ncbi:MAG: hypothetical protein ACT4NY_01860 [Pseudonocardiales bacterium]
MSLIEHPATLLAEATAASGDHVPPVITTGGPVALRLRAPGVPMLETVLARLRPGLRAAAPTGTAEVQDIRVGLDAGLARRLDQAIRATAPVGETGEPHRVRDGVHLVRKQAGAGQGRRSGYLLWDQENPQASSIVLGESGASAETVLLRLVRGVAVRVLLAAGWVPLHAACVLTPAGAVCLLGGRGSGKTTALLHLLTGAAGPVALVANSLVFLSPDGPVQVGALPTAIGLRAPTIALFPALRGLTGDAGVGADEASRTYLSTPAVATAFGVEQAAGGPVTAFVDVAFRGAQQAAWRVLDTGRGEAALAAAYLPDGLLDDPHEHARLAADHMRGHRERLRRCAESVRAARCESGTTGTAAVLGREVAELVAQAAR